jgi:hypothetical protein
MTEQLDIGIGGTLVLGREAMSLPTCLAVFPRPSGVEHLRQIAPTDIKVSPIPTCNRDAPI